MGVLRSRPTMELGLVLLLVGSIAQRSDLRAQADLSKLTTVLADLVRATPAAPTAAALAIERLPGSVQDALRGRRLRMSATGDVQVYVLVEAASDENLRQL